MLARVVCILLVLLTLQWSFQPCEAARILISVPYGTKSNQNMVVPLAMSLSERNHEVTLITNYKNDELDGIPGLRQIVLDELKIDVSKGPSPFDAMFSFWVRLNSLALEIKNTFLLPRQIAETIYANPEIQDLIKGVTHENSFDAVIVAQTLNRGSFPLAWHFKAPLVIITPNAMFPGVAPTLGDNNHPEYLPFYLTSFTDRMNLLERTINTVAIAWYDFFVHRWFANSIHSIAGEHIGHDFPSIEEIEKNVSLILTNTHPIITYPRIILPQVVEIGCPHCKEPKPLTRELEQFVSSGKGFIIFGIGSTLPMSRMPETIVQVFTEAFSRVDVQIIWQWKGEIKHQLPGNVKAVSWLPQQDLLGHELCRGFMTHGGLNSVQEAIYHGVPLIGLPFVSDQILNLNRAVRDGYGIKLDWSQLTADTLAEALNAVLNNPSYAKVTKQRSRIFRDQMQTPLERAVFAVEHVIRHNGTEHLRLGSADLAGYQRSLIDVYLVILLSFAIFFFSFLYCVKKSLHNARQAFSKAPDRKDKKRKTK